MNITHICLAGPFSDNMSYQENLMTKYHCLEGNKVTMITARWEWNSLGELRKTDKYDYTNRDGVHIIRLKMKYHENMKKKFKKYIGLYDAIKFSNPDIIFIHGCQFLDIKEIVKYAKNNKIYIYVDNHADFSNSATNFISKNFLHKFIWKHCAKIIEPFTKKFYGVLPARVEFLNKIYGIPMDKIELLVMGADDELIKKYCTTKLYESCRKKYNITDKSFVIVTGGKIDKAKYQTLILMKAIKKINNNNIKLFIFGSIDKTIREEFNSLCDENIKYLGWADTINSYKFFNMADLVIFPGRHSVYWEQVVAIGKPMICKYWDGTTHVDIGGNVNFIYNDNIDTYVQVINSLIKNQYLKYNKMAKAALNIKKNNFLYSEIAKKAISN